MKIEDVVKDINLYGRTQTVTVEFLKKWHGTLYTVKIKGNFDYGYFLEIENEDLFFLLTNLCVNEIKIINKYNA